MLEGLRSNEIIVGAYSTGEGICPMLAAHRAGGRTSLIAFARAWDRFAIGAKRRGAARRATPRELLILRTHLEGSLLEDGGALGLAGAIASHRELLDRRPKKVRPGDPDRSRELRSRQGWSWTRLVRRYDDYERALERLAREQSSARAQEAARQPA